MTEKEPYQVTVRFLSVGEAENVYGENEAAARQNAVILFSLVENLGKIAIDINGVNVAVYD